MYLADVELESLDSATAISLVDEGFRLVVVSPSQDFEKFHPKGIQLSHVNISLPFAACGQVSALGVLAGSVNAPLYEYIESVATPL